MQAPIRVTLSNPIQQLSGVKCRTTNKLEMNPSTAKIGQLWNDFFQQLNGQPIQSKIYSVYCNYESDHTGEYDVYVSTKISCQNLVESIEIPNEREFLVFTASGKMPETCIKLWQEIWHFFESHHEYKRAYLMDFEEYEEQDSLNIYISLQ